MLRLLRWWCCLLPVPSPQSILAWPAALNNNIMIISRLLIAKWNCCEFKRVFELWLIGNQIANIDIYADSKSRLGQPRTSAYNILILLCLDSADHQTAGKFWLSIWSEHQNPIYHFVSEIPRDIQFLIIHTICGKYGCWVLIYRSMSIDVSARI